MAVSSLVGSLVAGAGIGAAEGIITGGNIGKDALLGGLTGGITGGLLPAIGPVAPGIGQVLEGAAVGAGVNAIGGGNVGLGALTGGAFGALSSISPTGTSGSQASGGTAATPGGGVSSAAGTAAPAGIDTSTSLSTGLPSPGASSALGVDTSLNTGSLDIGAPPGALQTVGTGSGGTVGLPGSVDSGATAGGGSTSVGTGTSGDQFGSLPGAANAVTSSAAASTSGLLSNVPANAGSTLGGVPNVTTISSTGALGGAADALGGPTNLLVDANGNPLPGYDGSGASSPTFYSNGLTSPSGPVGAGSSLIPGINNKTAALALLGGVNLLRGNKNPNGENQILALAGQEQAQAAQLQSSLSSGNLPAGLQAGIDQALNASIASIKSQYASRGMSGSTAEQQDVQSARERAAAQAGQIAQQLYQTGAQELTASDTMYAQILGQSNLQNQQTSAAISNFAGALAAMG